MSSSKHRDLFAALDGAAAALGKGSAPSSAPSLADLEAYAADGSATRIKTPAVMLAVGHGKVGSMYAPSAESREIVFLARVNSLITTGEDSINLRDALVAGRPVEGIKKLGDVLDIAGLRSHPFYLEITREKLYSTDGSEIEQGIHVIRRGTVEFMPLASGTYSLNDLATMSRGLPMIISACPEGAFGRGVVGIPQHIFQVGGSHHRGGARVTQSQLKSAMKIIQRGGGIDDAIFYLNTKAA